MLFIPPPTAASSAVVNPLVLAPRFLNSLAGALSTGWEVEGMLVQPHLNYVPWKTETVDFKKFGWADRSVRLRRTLL